MIVSIAVLTLALAATAASPPATLPPQPSYMQPPAGWRSLGPPPADAPIDYGWVSPHFRDGSAHAGDSLSAYVRPIPPGSTLGAQVKEMIAAETGDGRTVASSKSHATCNGTQSGWTVDFRIQLSPSLTLSQVEHVAVFDGHVYDVMFTHRADLPVDAAVQASIDSLCPKNG